MSSSRRAPVRVVVVGLGLIGRQRAAAVHSMPSVELAATIDPHSPSDGGWPALHLAALDDLDPDAFDAAIVSVPHHVAPEIARTVLGAGKPILLEKPLGTTAAVARELEGLASTVRLPSFVGFNYRFLPNVRDLVYAVASGRLGKLRSIDMLIGHGGHPLSAEGWKLDPTLAGGGVLLDPGVHMLDLLLQLAPDAELTGVEGTRGFWGTGIEEDVLAAFRADELIASVRISHIRWVNAFRIEVFGEEGYAIAEGRGGNYGPMTLRIGERWGWMKTEDVTDQGSRGRAQRDTEDVADFGSREHSLRDELETVVQAWCGGAVSPEAPHAATMSEARRVTEFCDSIYARMT